MRDEQAAPPNAFSDAFVFDNQDRIREGEHYREYDSWNDEGDDSGYDDEPYDYAECPNAEQLRRGNLDGCSKARLPSLNAVRCDLDGAAQGNRVECDCDDGESEEQFGQCYEISWKKADELLGRGIDRHSR